VAAGVLTLQPGMPRAVTQTTNNNAFAGFGTRRPNLVGNNRRRSVVLLITDGHDTASWLTDDNVLESVRHAGAVIHVVRSAYDGFLDRLAEAAGGRVWSAPSERQLSGLFGRALEEMRARYLVTYSPEGVTKPGWHPITVKLREGPADITARPGYFVQTPR
jgi:hypothetical protein